MINIIPGGIGGSLEVM